MEYISFQHFMLEQERLKTDPRSPRVYSINSIIVFYKIYEDNQHLQQSNRQSPILKRNKTLPPTEVDVHLNVL